MRTPLTLLGVAVLFCLIPATGTATMMPAQPAASNQLSVSLEATVIPPEAYRAAAYLLDHYNASLQLIYESEDSGIHWLRMGEMPAYSWSYQQTYWAYSDNLYASLALVPFNLNVAKTINHKIASIPNVGQFRILNGSILQEYREVVDVVVESSPDYIILTRTYTGKLTSPALGYADELLYYSLNEYLKGNQPAALESFNTALGMWNGSCFVDEAMHPAVFNGVGAPTDSGYCANNRIGLALFVGKVLNIPVPDSLDTALWLMQNEDGGIASLSQNDEKLGSANVETTALALLQYNTCLIARLQGQAAAA